VVGARAGGDESLADLRRAERCGARLVVPEDVEWPGLTLHALTVAVAEEPSDRRSQSDRTVAPVPPLGLWVRGTARLDELIDRSVAIVGSRASTAYGEHVAGELGHRLGERGWTVVSGGAYGIDAAAHRGALAAEAPTVAVLACGIDRVYPAGNGALLARIADTGMLISEWPPNCAPLAHRFLVRNRLIAALTRGTVVVEAAARSGAQATARRAQRLGRRVMVVPGPVTSAMSVGCHELLRDKESDAVLVASAAHVIEEVGTIGDDLADALERPTSRRDGLSDAAVRVLDACPVRTGVSPERLAATSGVDVLDVLRVLPALELAELVEWTGSGWRLQRPPKPAR
jgi:DNA processing protein